MIELIVVLLGIFGPQIYDFVKRKIPKKVLSEEKPVLPIKDEESTDKYPITKIVRHGDCYTAKYGAV